MALRGLIAPLPPSDWLPFNQLIASASSLLHRWLPSLALPRGCPDGFKLLLVLLLVSAALAEVSYLFRSPAVGDIVFFRVPMVLQNCGLNKDVVFIKRVLATPGDFIEVRQGQLIVNGVAQKETYTATHSSYTMEAMVQR
ncbi:hypothetical protein ACQ4PT_057906 [Festuca glaucescens]